MNLINNCKFSDITQTMLSSGTLPDMLAHLRDIYAAEYTSFLDGLYVLGSDEPVDSSLGIATVKGFLSFAKLKKALDDGDASVEVSSDDGSISQISVCEAQDLLITAKEDAATIVTSFAALQDSVANGKELTEDIISRYWTQYTGAASYVGSGIKHVVDNLILSSTSTILEKVQGILTYFFPEDVPSSITEELQIENYTFGTPWSAWTISIDWDLSNVYTAFRDWFVNQFVAIINISTAIITGIFSIFKTAIGWIGNKVARFMNGDAYTRISNQNSLCDTGGFPIEFRGTALPSGEVPYLNELFHTNHGALQINVPGGLLLWYDYIESGGFYTYYLRFLPENQSNLIPDSDYPFTDNLHSNWYWDYDANLNNAHLPTIDGVNMLEQCQLQAASMGLVDPYNKLEPDWLDMESQNDVDQFCSSYRAAFVLFGRFLNEVQEAGDATTSVCVANNRSVDWSTYPQEFFPNNYPYIIQRWYNTYNLVNLTGSNVVAYVTKQSQGGPSTNEYLKQGLQNLLISAAEKYVVGITDNNYLVWPLMQVVYNMPSFGMHVTTNSEFVEQLNNIFTRAKRIATIATIAVVSIVAIRKLKFLATKASVEAELMIFSENWTGSVNQIKTLMKVRRKAKILAYLGGAYLSSITLGDNTSVYDNQDIITLIRGF